MSERYQMRGRIGRGGMSAVYRAYDTVMGREVALKRLLPIEETNLNESAGESLAREAAALARFSHPNVVTIFAFEEDTEGPYVVMELVEGDDLHAVMKSGALSWDDFRDIAGQCLEPLVAAADLNLLHRDIKPGNLMLRVTASGRFLVKLLDFGLAKFSQQPSLQTLDQSGSFLGSIDFIAPEQLELKPLDQRTDLYSLGCVFYYMLAQKSPFTGTNPAETSMNHLKHRCQPIGELREDVPPLVADWIMRLVSRRPGDRPADAREALRQFEEALRGTPHTAPAAGEETDEAPAAPVSAPPGEPVPPPGEPARPPTGSVGGRVIRTASGPVPSTRNPTGPAAPAARSRPTGPARPMGTTRATGPSRPAPRPSPAPAQGGETTRATIWSWIAGGAGILLGVIALWLLISGGEEEPPSPEGGAPAPNQALAYPDPLPRGDGQPEPPALPVTEGLHARFIASKGVYGRDYRGAPAPGEPVAAWINLASPVKERSLLRDPADATGAHLPSFGRYDGSAMPGLRGERPGLATTNRSALTMVKHDALLTAGFTLVAAMRIEAGDDRLFRVQPAVADGRTLQLSTGYDGKVSAICKGKADAPEARVSVPWPSGTPGLLVYVCDPEKREQRLHARPLPPGGNASASGPVEIEGAPFALVAIGKRGFGDSFDARTGNVHFEFVVYARVLTDEEIDAVSSDLARRHFTAAP